MAGPLLEVCEVRKNYGKTSTLGGVSFQVQEGELFGLLGPNGAGKTTLMSIISSLMESSQGQVKLAGCTLSRDNRELRKIIGLVPQELALYGELTARENLLFVGELYGLHGHRLAQRATDLLNLIGLADRAEHRARTFSGGMQRRLNLGMALIHEPKLLLLDEPTTGVDPQSRNHIFEGVRRLNRQGLTIIYTSHYMEEVQALCPRIGIMDHGQLIACDLLPNLLRTLQGFLRFRVPRITTELRERVKKLTPTSLGEPDEYSMELECADVKGTLIQLIGILNEMKVELISLETEEPNLEHVFLHLTGQALRD